MARGFGGLQRLLSRRGSATPSNAPVVAHATMALDLADLGPPPVLRPAAIFRQLLDDPAELAPAWLNRRPAAAPAPAPAAATEPVSSPRPTIEATAAVTQADAAEPAKPARSQRRSKTGATNTTTASKPAATASPARSRSRRTASPARDAADH